MGSLILLRTSRTGWDPADELERAPGQCRVWVSPSCLKLRASSRAERK
jgi:hypothetical protein